MFWSLLTAESIMWHQPTTNQQTTKSFQNPSWNLKFCCFGHFLRYTLLGPSLAFRAVLILFGINTVVETFFWNFGLYWCDNILQLLQIWCHCFISPYPKGPLVPKDWELWIGFKWYLFSTEGSQSLTLHYTIITSIQQSINTRLDGCHVIHARIS